MDRGEFSVRKPHRLSISSSTLVLTDEEARMVIERMYLKHH